MTGLKLVKKGEVVIKSGQLIVIDPCYLDGFGSEQEEINEFNNGLFKIHAKLQSRKTTAFSKGSGALLASAKLLLEGRFEEADSKNNEYERFNNEYERIERAKRVITTPGALCPPFFAQADGYVFFNNPIGDGYYPVVKTPRRVKVIFDYPLKAVKDAEGRCETDIERLTGDFLGTSSVDSGTQVAIDSSKAKIRNDIRDDLYCVVSLRNGVHQCMFVNGNYAISINV